MPCRVGYKGDRKVPLIHFGCWAALQLLWLHNPTVGRVLSGLVHLVAELNPHPKPFFSRSYVPAQRVHLSESIK